MTFIIVAWALSVVGVGVSRIWKIMVAPMRSGMMLIGRPKRCPTVSGADRSVAQRKGAKRSSDVLCSMLKKPMKNGMVIRTGMQPPTGLTLFSLNSLRVSVWIFCGLSLNFSRMACRCGWSLAMRLAERDAASVNGRKTGLESRGVGQMGEPPLGTTECTHVLMVS